MSELAQMSKFDRVFGATMSIVGPAAFCLFLTRWLCRKRIDAPLYGTKESSWSLCTGLLYDIYTERLGDKQITIRSIVPLDVKYTLCTDDKQ